MSQTTPKISTNPREKDLREVTYRSSSISLGAIGGGCRRWAEDGGGSEDVGCGGGIWDSWDDGGLGATAVGDGFGLESGEGVGLGSTSDGSTGGTARHSGGVNHGGCCVRGTSRRPHTQ